MGDRITYVGLDVHKADIVVAVAEGGLRGEVRGYGRIAHTGAALDRLMRRLGGEGVRLRFCYEAGPYQVAHRLVSGIGNPHRRQLASPVQPSQAGGVPPIRLDPVTRSLRDQ